MNRFRLSLTAEQEAECWRLARSGLPRQRKAAEERLAIHHGRLVYGHVLTHQQYIRDHFRLDFDQAMSAGMLGLAKAIRAFDLALGNKFSTCATKYIKVEIRKACVVENSLSRDHFRVMYAILNGTPHRAGKVHRSVVQARCRMAFASTSLNKELEHMKEHSGEHLYLKDLIPDPRDNAKEADEVRDAPARDAVVREAVATLPERLKIVLCQWFGIGCERKTLGAIGKGFGLTRQRMEQLKAKGMGMLRVKLQGGRI